MLSCFPFISCTSVNSLVTLSWRSLMSSLFRADTWVSEGHGRGQETQGVRLMVRGSMRGHGQVGGVRVRGYAGGQWGDIRGQQEDCGRVSARTHGVSQCGFTR